MTNLLKGYKTIFWKTHCDGKKINFIIGSHWCGLPARTHYLCAIALCSFPKQMKKTQLKYKFQKHVLYSHC